ncbi:hypothetical protein SAMN05444280_104120 [Tangfeifania diversioriginum]|uniref:Uncharacterized protein n=1 Tax=Tangfeifania diversioriginum TaxID=1168035 RepID=A0A1M6CWP4_9BACT|nr:hypothetical protein [Tangfeifania diversioriginum]SHI65416.1 hypothetical protein SAMN05444280_104120 [Tangfeifania diversioriginum]
MRKKADDYYDKKIDNDLKKKELEKKYGAYFSEDSELPPEMENQWLNSIDEFEKQFDNAKTITVWEYMDKPSFKTKDELKSHEISNELERLFELMGESNITLSTLCDVEDAELYRFITEELFQHEMDDIRIPGMMSCFTYEEFHPNAKLDIEQSIDYFFRMTMAKMENIGGTGYDMLYVDIEDHRDSNGNKIDKQKIIDSINNFLGSFDSFEIVTYNEKTFEINQEETDAKVTFTIYFKGLYENSNETCDFRGDGCFKLKPSEYGGWEMYHIDLPGGSIVYL